MQNRGQSSRHLSSSSWKRAKSLWTGEETNDTLLWTTNLWRYSEEHDKEKMKIRNAWKTEEVISCVKEWRSFPPQRAGTGNLGGQAPRCVCVLCACVCMHVCECVCACMRVSVCVPTGTGLWVHRQTPHRLTYPPCSCSSACSSLQRLWEGPAASARSASPAPALRLTGTVFINRSAKVIIYCSFARLPPALWSTETVFINRSANTIFHCSFASAPIAHINIVQICTYRHTQTHKYCATFEHTDTHT